jgi:chaperonin GroES
MPHFQGVGRAPFQWPPQGSQGPLNCTLSYREWQKKLAADQASPEETTMKLRPLHDRLVVERLEEKERPKGAIVIPDSAKEKPQRGKVIAVGNGKRLEDGTLIALDVRAGDHILFGKYDGNEITVDGHDYLILREDEVLAVVEDVKISKKAA